MTAMHTSAVREAAITQPPPGLEGLIAPVSVDDFVAGYWERQPLLVRRGDPGYYAGLLSLPDMDRLLSTSGFRSAEVRLVSDGREIPVEQVVSAQAGKQSAALEGVYEAYRKGATVNLVFLHERYEPLGALCRSLAAQFSCACQTNVYLTPGGRERGLTPHYDTHDVFVVQAYGSKHWRLYDSPTELPLGSQAVIKPVDGFGEPVREFDLEAGDLLYLPRGTVHEAVSNDSASLHLTIGVIPIVWGSVARDILDAAIAEDADFRRSLPVGFAEDPEKQKEAAARLAELVGRFAAGISADTAIQHAARKALVTRQPALGGHLLDLEAVGGLTLDTEVWRRPELQWLLAGTGDAVTLEFHGKVVQFPPYVAEELRAAASGDRFTGRGLPGALDDAGRINLVGILVREGFCTLC
jgi:ribosomal protein L16 Arg81 hydroxylase